MDLGARARTLTGACLAHPEWIEMTLPRYLLKVVWPSTTLPTKQSGVNGPSSAGPMRALTAAGRVADRLRPAPGRSAATGAARSTSTERSTDRCILAKDGDKSSFETGGKCGNEKKSRHVFLNTGPERAENSLFGPGLAFFEFHNLA
jgi:hypothetical protein